MTGKIPDIKKLRSLLQESDNKLKASKSENQDKLFLGVVRKEIEELDKELGTKHEKDDLCISSESEESKRSSLEISFCSELSVAESPLKTSEITQEVKKNHQKKSQSGRSYKQTENNPRQANEKSREKELEK